jgi:hypothetical protein
MTALLDITAQRAAAAAELFCSAASAGPNGVLRPECMMTFCLTGGYMRRKRKIADRAYVVLRYIPENERESGSLERAVDVWAIVLTQEDAELEVQNMKEQAEDERIDWRFWWVETGWPPSGR